MLKNFFVFLFFVIFLFSSVSADVEMLLEVQEGVYSTITFDLEDYYTYVNFHAYSDLNFWRGLNIGCSSYRCSEEIEIEYNFPAFPVGDYFMEYYSYVDTN